MIGRIIDYTVKERNGYKYVEINVEIKIADLRGAKAGDKSMLKHFRSRVGNFTGINFTTLEEEEQTTFDEMEE